MADQGSPARVTASRFGAVTLLRRSPAPFAASCRAPPRPESATLERAPPASGVD